VIRVALKFGAFVVVCLFFTGYLAFTIGNLDVRDPLGRDTYKLSASFDDVSGLLPNDNVKVAGVVIGKVTSVKVRDGKAVIEMAISNKHDNIPREGTTAAVRWRNLIGQRYIYLYPGKPGGVALQGGDRIRSTTSVVDLGELFNKLGPIVTAIDPNQVNNLLDTLTQALDGREDKVGAALDDLATLAKGLATRDAAIERLVTNLNTVAGTIDQRDAEIDAMLDNLTNLADAFNDDQATLDAALTQVSEFGTNLHEVLSTNSAQLDRLLANLASVTDTVRTKLPELNTFLAGFAQASNAVFRAGNRGEFLNQKILCVFVGPPTSNAAGCPTGDPIKGLSLSNGASTYQAPPITGPSAISSLLKKAVGAP
jgi:phospholipid/cholesterol/gamma-HCH transport system substrate-binding protein